MVVGCGLFGFWLVGFGLGFFAVVLCCVCFYSMYLTTFDDTKLFISTNSTFQSTKLSKNRSSLNNRRALHNCGEAISICPL